MYGMSFVTAFATLYMLLMTTWLNQIAVSDAAVMRATAAGHLSVYASFISQYAQANSAFTGSVPDASAALPTWFHRLPGELNYVVTGKAYVYTMPVSRADGFAMARAIGGQSVGIDDSGNLAVPGLGHIGVAIPGAVSPASLVIVR